MRRVPQVSGRVVHVLHQKWENLLQTALQQVSASGIAAIAYLLQLHHRPIYYIIHYPIIFLVTLYISFHGAALLSYTDHLNEANLLLFCEAVCKYLGFVNNTSKLITQNYSTTQSSLCFCLTFVLFRVFLNIPQVQV